MNSFTNNMNPSMMNGYFLNGVPFFSSNSTNNQFNNVNNIDARIENIILKNHLSIMQNQIGQIQNYINSQQFNLIQQQQNQFHPGIIETSPENKESTRLKIRFTKEEDEKLKKLVDEELAKKKKVNWFYVSKNMGNRTSRQCRERYNNYIRDSEHKYYGKWSPEEDKLLLSKYAEYGPQWCIISKFFGNRSNINVKNRFASLQRKRKSENENNSHLIAEENYTFNVDNDKAPEETKESSQDDEYDEENFEMFWQNNILEDFDNYRPENIFF